jgi:NAD(P)H-hydrate epimerase
MNEELFFRNFPKKPDNAYKGTYGKTLLAGGSWGTAGALSLNIIGAKTVGAPYIDVLLPDSIYPILASQHITPVFHPFAHNTMQYVADPLIHNARAIAYGSGAVWFDKKEDCLDLILQNSSVPVILDAEALRLLEHNTYLLKFVRVPVIITPHIGEFAGLLNLPAETILGRKMEYASRFAKENNVIVVLKGPSTIVVSPLGDTYINNTGNQALAQAGSGDLMTGIMAGILTFTKDVFTAVCMAVWLHGRLAEIGTEEHSCQNFPLECYPELMDRLFRKHGF